MIMLKRISSIVIITFILCGCLPAGPKSLSKIDLSQVVLQQNEVPEQFSNLTVFEDQAADSFFPRADDDTVKNFYGVSYLYPKDGLNYIYSLVVVYDDETSSKNVYEKITGPVNSQLHLLKDKIGDESLLFSSLPGTSFFSVWRYKEAIGYVALISKLQLKYGYDDIVSASELMQARLLE